MRVLAGLGVLLAGCAYQVGSFSSVAHPFGGQYATIGCLDLALERRPDLPNGDVVIGYTFGNRCDHPAIVDLAKAAVVGRTADGREHDLPAYDPLHVIEALPLDGRLVGSEAIAYQSDAPLREICIDAASIAREATATWMCFASRPQLSEAP